MLAPILGIVAFAANNLFRPSAKKMSREDMEGYLRSEKSFFQELFEGAEYYLRIFWEDFLRDALYNTVEKQLTKFRLLVMKLERRLQNLTEWLKGRRLAPPNGQKSEYWQQISDWKNGEKNGDDLPK